MSNWTDLDIEAHILEILREVQYCREHHFGRPFLTAYQIAIIFNQRFPGETRQLGLQVGGKNIGERNSLAQYLAGQLSKRILSGEIRETEGAFISNINLSEISLEDGGRIVVSSLTDTQYDLSMFRVR